jgi:hypothetical protein
MRRAFAKIFIFVVGIAIVTSVAGCSGTNASSASSSSSPPADPNAAFKQYEEAAKPVECSSASREMDEAADKGNFGIMKNTAFQYRDALATLDARLGKIDFPAAAQPIVKRMRELNSDQLAGLNELGQYDGKDEARLSALRNRIWFDDSSLVLEGDHLRAALAHPVHQAGYAADLLEVAQATFYKDDAPVRAKWAAAMAAKDLDGAKAANGIEIAAIQRYIDKLDSIDFPPGTFQGQANILREHLRGLIDFDRRQVDVSTAAEIVETPAEGVPDVQAAVDAKDRLWADLVKNFQATDPSAKC